MSKICDACCKPISKHDVFNSLKMKTEPEGSATSKDTYIDKELCNLCAGKIKIAILDTQEEIRKDIPQESLTYLGL